MNEENFEEWDADFLDQLIQVEELALSKLTPSTNANTNTSANLPYPTQRPLTSEVASHNDSFISYSPPRELSQRIPAVDCVDPSSNGNFIKPVDNVKDLEIQRLKRELGRVSKQLTDLEYECVKLKKERNQKQEQSAIPSSKNVDKDSIYHLKGINLKCGDSSAYHHGAPQQLQNAKTFNGQFGPEVDIGSSRCNDIGVQVNLSSHLDLNKKLQCIWRSPSHHKLREQLISKLFSVCSSEFHVLFGCMGINTSPKVMQSLAVGRCDFASPNHMQYGYSSEAEKVSHFYSVLTKISSGVMRLEALLQPLLELCGSGNAALVHGSLHILHVFLKHLVNSECKVEGRDNIMVEGILSKNGVGDCCGSGSEKNRLPCTSACDASYLASGAADAETLYKKGCSSHGKAVSLSCINWVSLFEFMHQITMWNSEESVRAEAVSIMNLIVISSPYKEREKFGQTSLLENISQLLKREAGLRVQKQALHLLYLLLNCPSICLIFCSGCEEEKNAGGANISEENHSGSKGFTMILDSLADCIACSGSSVQELELCRTAIVVLAFVASSGKSGFDILVDHKLRKEANFLMLILQVLVSEIDNEAAVLSMSADIFRARTLLMREALILLNRLVSSPSYSGIVLQVLTNSRDMANLTIDVANRLSKKEQRQGQSDSKSRQMRESEVLELGWVFKKRVYTYLGDNIL